MYGPKTADENFIKAVGEIAKTYPGSWAIHEYSPGGPCKPAGCSEEGYSVDEYLKRLNMLEENGVRLVSVEANAKNFLRTNFYEAVKKFLAEED